MTEETSELDALTEHQDSEAEATAEQEDTTTEKGQDGADDGKADDDDAPAASREQSDGDSEMVPMAAVLDERRKRQKLEAQLRELQDKKDGEDERPDVFEDQDAAFKHLESKFDQKLIVAERKISRRAAMREFDDYEEKESVFLDLANESPELIRQMDESGDPAFFAYTYAKKHLDMKQVSDPGWKEKLEAEIRAKIKAEMEQESEGEEPPPGKAPSLARATSSGGNKTPRQPTLEELFDGR